ncbi:hypothetical protein UFOVP125_24 [uncultured Caudovirales phage]|uniref:Uncharacterized protein n=1 Tax=uncultured Caudovirales phage TaxID=2100421 RepID=A0A6J5LBG6_9CAUD|nr:hypothetical protein UFOVP125_24 [uncultured Caudovirales phage]
MNCCNANGVCDQGKDCPVRKQRIKEINDAYINGYNDAQLGDPLDDLADTFKGLIAWLGLALGVWIVCLLIWGK